MVKMAWERGGTRARWENGEGHMGKVGLPPFCRSGPIFCGARILVRHRKLHFCGARARCASFLWRIHMHAPQKALFLWRTVGSAPQKVPRWIWPNHWTWDPHIFCGAWDGMRHRILAFCGAWATDAPQKGQDFCGARRTMRTELFLWRTN